VRTLVRQQEHDQNRNCFRCVVSGQLTGEWLASSDDNVSGTTTTTTTARYV